MPMAAGEGTGDAPGCEEHINAQGGPSSLTKSLGKGFQDWPGIAPSISEEHSIILGESSSSMESLSPAIQGIVIHTAWPDLAQPNLEVLAVVAPESAAPAQSNFAPVVALPTVPPAEPNVGPIVALYNVAPAQINAIVIVNPFSALLGQPNVDVDVVAPGLTFAQPCVALFVDAAPAVAPAQPYVAPNVARPAGPNVAPPGVAPFQLSGAAIAAPPVALLALAPNRQNPTVNVARPVVAAQQNVAQFFAPPASAPAPAPAQRNVAPVVAPSAPAPAPAQRNVAPVVAPPAPAPAPAQRNVAPVVAPPAPAPAPAQRNVAPVVAPPAPAPAPAQRNVPLVVAPPAPAPAQPNAAAVVAPPGVPPAPPNVIDINDALTRSRLRSLRTSDPGGEGILWPKLRRN